MTAEQFLSIGELASITGVTVAALRHYDDVGVVTPVGRVGGKRRFDRDAVSRVNFVRRAQVAGFSLAEINEVLTDTPARAQELVAVKIAELRQQQAELELAIAALEEIQACECNTVASCPTLSSQL